MNTTKKNVDEGKSRKLNESFTEFFTLFLKLRNALNYYYFSFVRIFSFFFSNQKIFFDSTNF